MQVLDQRSLERLFNKYVHTWARSIPIHLSFAPNSISTFTEYVYECRASERDSEASPGIGGIFWSPFVMGLINNNKRTKYNEYISRIIEEDLDNFSEICWTNDDGGFGKKVFKLMISLKAKQHDETKAEEIDEIDGERENKAMAPIFIIRQSNH